MRAYYFFLFSFVKWPTYCLYIVRDFLLLKLKEVLAMKESGCKSYEDLPLFLNAATVAKALGATDMLQHGQHVEGLLVTSHECGERA